MLFSFKSDRTKIKSTLQCLSYIYTVFAYTVTFISTLLFHGNSSQHSSVFSFQSEENLSVFIIRQFHCDRVSQFFFVCFLLVSVFCLFLIWKVLNQPTFLKGGLGDIKFLVDNFSFSTLKMSSYCFPASVVLVRNQLLIVLKMMCMWYIIFFLMLLKFSEFFALDSFLMMYLGVDSFQFTLLGVLSFLDLQIIVPQIQRVFFFGHSFSSSLSSLFFLGSHYVYIDMLYGIPHILKLCAGHLPLFCSLDWLISVYVSSSLLIFFFSAWSNLLISPSADCFFSVLYSLTPEFLIFWKTISIFIYILYF